MTSILTHSLNKYIASWRQVVIFSLAPAPSGVVGTASVSWLPTHKCQPGFVSTPLKKTSIYTKAWAVLLGVSNMVRGAIALLREARTSVARSS